MLQKLSLDITEMNKNDGSVSYHYENDTIYGLTNPKHELWSSIPHEKPMLVFYCKELEPGIYETGLNFEHDISLYSDVEAYGSYKQLTKEGIPIESNDLKEIMKGVTPYGVADNINQIKEHFKDMLSSNNPIVLSVTEMRKEDQPQEDGWRWHKWGQYIGNQNPQCEYLYDEPNIQSVYVFHVYAVRPKMEKKIENKRFKM